MTSIFIASAVATAIICTGIICYARGYKAGCAYCMAQMKPLEETARELQRAIAERKS